MAHTDTNQTPRGDSAEEFKTLEKLTDMIAYAYPILAQYPKSEKFTLVADIKRSMYDALRLCVKVGKRKSKKTALADLDVEIATLKRFVRISFTLKFLNMQHYKTWSGLLAEIGRMIGGMIKADNQTPPAS